MRPVSDMDGWSSTTRHRRSSPTPARSGLRSTSPAASAEASDTPMAPTMTPARASTMDGEFLLLIADADAAHASRLADELAAHSVHTIVCTDGAEALLAAGAEHPDAVLGTAALPPVGAAMLTRTLSRRTGIPVVLGVGDGDGPAAAEALAAGATACVVHPYRLRELLPILRAIRPDGLVPPEPALT